ncbi:MAG: hypothetical protein J0M18_18380 [Ignavibacteria bacterium]|nr:hypothetical protein [Ignavibacteria bacterium]
MRTTLNVLLALPYTFVSGESQTVKPAIARPGRAGNYLQIFSAKETSFLIYKSKWKPQKLWQYS